MTNPNTATNTTAYDEVPYSSFPFSQTNPASIAAIAGLFGLKPPHHGKARILELGCASGNNILSIASLYPKAECVGIDLSKVQIAEGQKRIKDLGIKNLELKQMSILDIDKKLGKFDYIICHGVFSWVPEAVQKKILEICSKNLSADGVAYVSYNTMPGWSAIKSLREMMLYHTARFADSRQKAEQARLLLKFIRDSLGENNKSTYAEIVENEMKLLSGQSDWYLLHDHLEENNTQLYFYQFMEMAAAENLQYLAETSVSTMFTGNLPAETAKVLATSDDIVRTEQYLDFIYNRRFRSTLLCHKDRILRRNITPDAVANLSFINNFKLPENIAEYKFGSGQVISFNSGTNVTLTTSDILLIAAISILAQQRHKPLSMVKLCKLVADKIKSGGVKIENEKDIPQLLGLSLLRGIFCGGINVSLGEGNFVTAPSARPKAYSLAQYQSRNQSWVTNLRHESTNITAFDQALLPLLNGKNDEKSLLKPMLAKFEDGALNMSENNQQITDMKTVAKKLPEVIKTMLQRYAELALLEE